MLLYNIVNTIYRNFLEFVCHGLKERGLIKMGIPMYIFVVFHLKRISSSDVLLEFSVLYNYLWNK